MNYYNLISHFQPIFSLKDNKLIGLEALSRGVTEDNQIISPTILFKEANIKGQTLELDRKCRLNALKEFSKLKHTTLDETLLFMNVDISIMDKYKIDFGWTSSHVNSLNINPGNVVLEIVEHNCENKEKLIEFVNNYRSQGFLIAIDDFGTDNSNFARIVEIKPDIIKIAGDLIKDISKNFVKKSIVKSIVSLSKKIGTIIIAECVENIEDLIKCYEIGIDLFQGYYFSKPKKVYSINELYNEIKVKVPFINKCIENNMSIRKNIVSNFNSVVESIISNIKCYEEILFDSKLDEIKKGLESVESVYLLNEHGIQISSIYCKDCSHVLKRNIIFRYGDLNSDHSQKDYFLNTSCTLNNRYITEKYISPITNAPIVTVASKFKNIENKLFILCINFDITEIEEKSYNSEIYEQIS